MTSTASDHPLLPWLALREAPGLGPVRAWQLWQRLGPGLSCPERLLEMGVSEAMQRHLLAPQQALLERLLAWCRGGPGRHILTRHHPDYPLALNQLPDAPLLLFVEGNSTALNVPQLAVVGSRHPSYVGKQNTQALIPPLVEAGLAITSGLAMGIDGLAHRAALDAGGITLAVFGSGLARCHPKRHARLAGELVEHGGALLSECYPWEPPQAFQFPRRNRIISGLSLGVLVMEAAERSGSLITARFALEQGREVFAVPGARQNPQACGCNRLIQQGAKLVNEANDVLEELAGFSAAAVKIHETATEQSLPYPDLLDNVDSEATAPDVIAARCQQPVHEVLTRLVELELAGWVESVPGGYVRARRS
ncbi:MULTISPECIES: DNA-processing protein DprA [Oceanimonas]|uniref:DNA-protecting protein DprA n=1 Tax=Oceanimonas doudoroffii TaxID=84158 RepID=A0A233RAF1_9GAMM|nr:MULTISPECIES: DNA-processing protein DprA [Oceanimonas]NHH99250.1 DNA processing protein DprA [Oceanimonas sp. MB9]OXY80370.1 DNA-protecting protein DprA [Oceanimonas doudoroffii]